MHAREHLDGRLCQRQITGRNAVGGDPRPGGAKIITSSHDGFAESGNRQGGEHVARAAEETVEGGYVDPEKARRSVGLSGGADDG